MTPSQLSFLGSLGGTPTVISLGSPVQKSFLERFFDQSKLIGWERDEPNLEQYFEKLENAGYTISDTQIVFGSDGESWPILISPKKVPILFSGLVTGERGSKGMGLDTMISYLKRVCRLLDECEKTRSVGSAAMSSSSSSSGVAASSAASSSSKPKSTIRPTPLSTEITERGVIDSQRKLFDTLKLSLGSGSVSIRGVSDVCLRDLQKKCGSLKSPGVGRNALRAEEFLGSEIFCFGEKLVVTKDWRVLVKDERIEILPMDGRYFDHGGRSYSDIPCKEHLNLRGKLSNLIHINEMLPYLNALVYPT